MRLKPSISEVALLRGLWRQHPRYRGCVGHWLFNERMGLQIYDISGFGRDGTLTNGPTWATGQFGPAIDFDGSTNYIDVSSVSGLFWAADFTVSLWYFNTGGVGDRDAMLGHWGGSDTQFIIHAREPTGLRLLLNGSVVYVATSGMINTDAWNHICITRSGTSVTTYTNGQFRRTDTQAGASPATTATTVFGGQSTTPDRPVDNRLDLYQFWNRSVNLKEAQSLFFQPFLEFEWAQQQLTARRFFLIPAAGRISSLARHGGLVAEGGLAGIGGGLAG